MSTITKTPDGVWYVAEFFPNAIENSTVDKPDKGWKAVMGDLNGEQVPMRAYYRTDMYSLNDVIKLAENLRECKICRETGQNHDVTSIEVANNYQLQNQGAAPRPALRPSKPLVTGGTGDMFTDVLANTLITTMLTPLGQMVAAKMVGDSDMLEKVSPKTTEDALNIAADFFSAGSPKNMMFRDPKEMKEMAMALRAGTKRGEEEEKKKTKEAGPRRAVGMGRTLILS